MVRFKKAALVICGAALLSGNAIAQINVDELGAAQSYDIGTIQSGGLDSALWQGTTAAQATALIEKINTGASGSARDLIRAALLSGGVPPQAGDSLEREAYMAARLAAILGLGDLAAFDSISEQSGINRASPAFTKVMAERALLGGDMAAACAITDNITTGRKSPYWAKIRAFCHVVRDETPAAELTADLLARSGHKDKTFFDLLGKLTGTRPDLKMDSVETPLQIAMVQEIYKTEPIKLKTLPTTMSATLALDTQQSPEKKFDALFAAAPILSPEQIRTVLGSLADAPLASAEQLATKEWDAAIWGGAFQALSQSNDMDNRAVLAGTLLEQADKHGLLVYFSRALEAETGFIPAQTQAKYKANIFARTAALRGDINSLRGLFQALEADDPLRGRIALASDALGNGFMLGELGIDIETRLAGEAKDQQRAVRDAYIAVAMGANLSGSAEQTLQDVKLAGRAIKPGALLALQAAARRGSKAETALRAAQIINGKPLRPDSFGALLNAMTSAGMHAQAGRLAALDLLQ